MKKYCEYCGLPYNPDFTILHGENHLILRKKRFKAETGELIE
jgi:hypothetical protein